MNKTLVFITIYFLPIMIMAKNHGIEKVGLQLGWKHQFQYAGFYIAHEKGFYQEAGLDVTIKEFDHSIDIVNDVVSGNINFGIGKSSLLIERYKGKPVIALGALYQSSPSVLVTTNPSLKSLKDIHGKKIMVTADAIRSASITSMLLSNGITENDFILQKHSFDYNDLIERNTDAMASYLSNEPYFLSKKNIPYQIFDPKDYGYDFYGDILFTSENEINNSPERVKKFYAASKKGWLWAFENIEQTAQLIYEKYNTQKKSLESLIYEGQILKKLALVEDIDFGHISINKFNYIAEVFRLGNFIDKVEPLNGFVDPLNLNRTEIKIGIHAIDGIETTLKRWASLTLHLNNKLDQYYFTIVPLNYHQLSDEIERNTIDFFITNPLYYVQLEQQFSVSRIATLLNSDSSILNKFSEFGGVILTKRGNKNIKTIEDINGKTFAGVDKHSFGGWIMAYEELFKHGISKDDIQLTFLQSNYAVVESVLKGKVESGTVRTGILEQMAKKGNIKLSDINIINAKSYKDFPYVISTKLYPEWPFSKLNHTSNKLANDVSSVLLDISSEHNPFIEVKMDEWTVPLDYNDVHDLLKKLHTPTYEFNEITLVDVFQKYALTIYSVILGFILLTFRLLYIKKLNRTLDDYNFKLDQEVKERTNNLKKANRKLKVLANTDPLTGISNRGYFFNQGKKYFNIAIRNRTPLHLLMLDLDLFKGINDEYGHQAGDLVLKEFTQTIEKTLRSSDLFGRIGGEEFSILLQDTSIEGAKLFAERIIKNIETLQIMSSDEVIKVTVSIGLVTLKDENNIHDLLKKADIALYKAKDSGRNKYVYV